MSAWVQTVRRIAAALLAAVGLLGAVPAAAQGFDHTHAAWNVLLKKHVVLIHGARASQLDYAGMAADRAALKSYLASLSAVTQSQFDAWPKAERMAFLINAYNAFTVEKILTRYPDIRSIWDFGKLFGNPFKDEFFSLFGRAFTLDRIEHDTLRKPGSYDDVRVHYAVNCASIGCPMLREEAYVGTRLEAQLEEQAVRFLSDRSRNRFNAGASALEVSKIFDWFREDWARGARGYQGSAPAIASREQYFARYANLLTDDPAGRATIAAGKASITHLDYDWSLNGVRR